MSGGVIRQMHMAHDSVDDEEFQEVIEQAKEEMQPLTRQTLVEIGKRKKRKKAREERDTRLSAQETLFPTGQLYTVLLADPPWMYDFSLDSGDNIENHYRTMDVEEIKGLDVPSLCYSDSV